MELIMLGHTSKLNAGALHTPGLNASLEWLKKNGIKKLPRLVSPTSFARCKTVGTAIQL